MKVKEILNSQIKLQASVRFVNSEIEETMLGYEHLGYETLDDALNEIKTNEELTKALDNVLKEYVSENCYSHYELDYSNKNIKFTVSTGYVGMEDIETESFDHFFEKDHPTKDEDLTKEQREEINEYLRMYENENLYSHWEICN